MIPLNQNGRPITAPWTHKRGSFVETGQVDLELTLEVAKRQGSRLFTLDSGVLSFPRRTLICAIQSAAKQLSPNSERRSLVVLNRTLTQGSRVRGTCGTLRMNCTPTNRVATIAETHENWIKFCTHVLPLLWTVGGRSCSERCCRGCYKDPPEGHMWVHGRLTKKQATARPENIWPDLMVKNVENSQPQAINMWAEEKTKLDAARERRGIYFIPKDDPDYG